MADEGRRGIRSGVTVTGGADRWSRAAAVVAVAALDMILSGVLDPRPPADTIKRLEFGGCPLDDADPPSPMAAVDFMVGLNVVMVMVMML